MITKFVLPMALMALCCSAPAVTLIMGEHPVWGALAAWVGLVAFVACGFVGMAIIDGERDKA